MTHSMAYHAIQLAKQGFAVFPLWTAKDGRCACGKADCGDAGKHPIGSLARHGCLDATTDLAIVYKWWDRYPDANIGIATGSGRFVVDVDAEGEFEKLCNGHEVPVTVCARTGRGKQYWYTTPEPVTNTTGLKDLKIDLRGTGGYVVAPPSTHVTGRQYEWIVSPFDANVAPAPDWLLGEITTKPVAGPTIEVPHSFETHPGQSEPGRTSTLWTLTGHAIVEDGPDAAKITPRALRWNLRNVPPLPEAKVAKHVVELCTKHKAAMPVKAGLSSFTSIEETEVLWLWPQRIPRGKITLLAGYPGVGKSFFWIDLASRVSTGHEFPDGAACAPGNVIVLSSEDDPSDTLKPRLRVHRADFSRIYWVDLEACYVALDKHVPYLEELVKQVEPVSLIVLDPISGHLGKCDSHKNAEVRAVLGPLAAFARRKRVAIVGVTHYSKSEQSEGQYRVSGSVAFTAFARVVYAIEKDKDDSQLRVVRPLKNNLSSDATGLSFRLTDGRVTWEDTDLMFADVRQSTRKIENAEDWLYAMLASHPQPADHVQMMAKLAGISERTLNRAKKDLGVASRKTAFDGQWSWELPEQSFPPEE